ncbi:MAG TPA: glycosyltransferase [Geodermatophilus sp.]|nr:glycosyltransferase [Geodermatophilus sp.]
MTSTSARPVPRPPAPPEGVTVVVMSWNRREDLLATLPRHEAPVVLVDNGSSDGTAEAVRAALPGVTVLPLRENVGARARTIGAGHARTEFVAFADDDSWWAPGDLAAAVAVMRAHPRLAVLNARVLVGPEERLDPLCPELAASPLGAPPHLPGPRLLGFIGCAAMVRTEAFLAAGGFDPVVRFPGEEERLSLDLAAAGWDVAYVDSVTVHHHPSARRHDAAARRTAIWRSRVLTAVMRLPARDVARTVLAALRTGAPERLGVWRALPDLPAALRRRRRVPAHVLADLRLLAA